MSISEDRMILGQAYIRAVLSRGAIESSRLAATLLVSTSSSALELQTDIEARHRALIATALGRPMEGNDRLETLKQKIAANRAASLRAAVDTAALVAAHAMIDDVVYQCLRALFRATPLKCAHLVAKKKVDLGQIASTSYPDLVSQELLDLEQKYEEASLLKKFDSLLSVLKPDPHALDGPSGCFSRTDLERIDNLRHDLVHRSGPRELLSFQADLELLWQVLSAIWRLTEAAVAPEGLGLSWSGA
jgi:hypothetical protein